MKMIEVRTGPYWDISLFGRSIARKLVFLRMECDAPSHVVDVPEDVSLVPMDEDLIKQADDMKYYQVMRFYKTDRAHFYGVAAVREGAVCGFVCGMKQRRHAETASDESDSFYIKYVYIDPNSRGSHLSALLIQSLANHLHLPLHLKVRENNPPAIKVYQKVGFRFVTRKELINLMETKSITLKREKIHDQEFLAGE